MRLSLWKQVRRNANRWLLCIMTLSVTVLYISGRAQTPAPGSTTLSPHDQVGLHMVQLRMAGETARARDVLREYLESNPTDVTMLYNLACLDLALGDVDQALEDLEQALAGGYTNFRLIDFDPDLQLLREDDRFLEMASRYEHEFRDLLQSRALTLSEGYSTSGIELSPNSPLVTGVFAPSGQVDITYLATELKIQLTIEDAAFRNDAPPWNGGSGVLVNLVLPLSPDDYESKRYFSYGIGFQGAEATAFLIGKHGQTLLQFDESLSPEIVRRDNLTSYEISIPWNKFTPYAPPLDQEMGLNVFYVGAGQGADRPVLSLMPEDKLAFESNPWRRYVPVYFESSDRSRSALSGRLYNRLIEWDTVDIQVGLWTPSTGEGNCRLSVLAADNSPSGDVPPEDIAFENESGLNFFNHSVDVSALPPGRYELQVQMTTPDQTRFTRLFPFCRVDPSWVTSLNERIYELPEAEKSILTYHIFMLDKNIDRRHPQDDPAPLLTARENLRRLIERSETGGTCLPEEGFFVGGFAASTRTQRFCAMYLPEGFRELTDPKLLVVLAPVPGTEEQLARALGPALSSRPDLIILVPQSHGYSSLTTRIAAFQTERAIEWAQMLLGAGPVYLAGLGTGADAALETSLNRPDLCDRVLLDTASLLGRPDDSTAGGPQASLQTRSNELPYTLISSGRGADRRRQVVSFMKSLDFQVAQMDAADENQAVLWIMSWLQAPFQPVR